MVLGILDRAFDAIIHGVDPLVAISLVLIAVVIQRLTELIKLQTETNVKLDAVQDEIRSHGTHQTARMEEIRKFMLNWWERFGPTTRA